MSKDKTGNWFKRHKILTGVGALIVIGVIASAAGGGNKTNSTASTSNNSQSASSKTSTTTTLAKIGQPARDGKFEFTVNKQTCGVNSVGDQYVNKTAQGQYCVLNITVKNIGNEAQTFDSSNEYVYDASNNKLSADGTASSYDNSGDEAFLNEINPGNSVTGNVVFDVPKGVTPVTAELHDSAFSGGVKVSLQ